MNESEANEKDSWRILSQLYKKRREIENALYSIFEKIVYKWTWRNG